MNSHRTAANASFTLTYEFDAPKQMVFEAFGNAAALNEWWGPVEAKNTVISLDFRPGGIFHYKMDFNGHITYGRMVFGTIDPYNLLEFSNAFANENAIAIPAPFDIKIPMEIFYRMSFTEQNGKTTLTMSGEPVNATAEELAGFKSIDESMQQGFGASFFKLAEYLRKK